MAAPGGMSRCIPFGSKAASRRTRGRLKRARKQFASPSRAQGGTRPACRRSRAGWRRRSGGVDGGPGWVVGVQWHPERMPDDPFAAALFRRLVKEARGAAKEPKERESAGGRRGRRSKPAGSDDFAGRESGAGDRRVARNRGGHGKALRRGGRRRRLQFPSAARGGRAGGTGGAQAWHAHRIVQGRPGTDGGGEEAGILRDRTAGAAGYRWW